MDKKELLETVERAIQEIVSQKISSYKIGERMFTYIQLQSLIELRNQLRAELGMPITVIGNPFDDIAEKTNDNQTASD